MLHLFQEPCHDDGGAGLRREAITMGGALSALSMDHALGAVDIGGVTARELEVLRLVELGFTARKIAAELVISYHTVRNHTASLRRKLGANSNFTLRTKARELGLV